MVAGVDTHRYSLSNMVMLKDNHIDACGGIAVTVRWAAARASVGVRGHDLAHVGSSRIKPKFGDRLGFE